MNRPSTAVASASARRDRPRTRARAIGAIAAFVGSLFVVARPDTASAVTPISDGSTVTNVGIAAIDSSAYRLQMDGTDAGYAAGVEQANPSLAPTSLSAVAGHANVSAQPLCTSTQDLMNARGFCWNDANGDETGTTWYPQGITTTVIADHSSPLDGHRLVLITSHNYADADVRLSIADVTDPNHVNYLHVLLVVPSAAPATGFVALKGHGDAAIVYQHYLYVGNDVDQYDGSPAQADESGFNVFDLNRFWPVDTSLPSVGRGSDGKFHGAGYQYVLPRLNTATYPNPGCQQDTTVQPCITAGSLDTSGPTPMIVTAAGSAGTTFGAQNGVIIRWPLDPSTGSLATAGDGAVHASAAYVDPVPGVQGIAMKDGMFVLSSICPEWPTGGSPYCLYTARPNTPVVLWARSATNGENLGYDPQRNELWYANEYYQDRMVIHVPWPQRRVAAGDFSGDGRADVLEIDNATGYLYLYPGLGNGAFGQAVEIGYGWNSMTSVVAGKFDHTGRMDLLAVDSATGILWLYPGSGSLNGLNTLGDRQNIGDHWNPKSQLTTVDLDHDGVSELLAIDLAGILWMYPGSGSINDQSTLRNPVEIGTGWGIMSRLTGVDLNGDGVGDVVSIDPDGIAWVYPGSGAFNNLDTLGPRTTIKVNWDAMTDLVPGEFTGDSAADLEARTGPGTVSLYPGSGAINGTSTLGSGTQISVPW